MGDIAWFLVLGLGLLSRHMSVGRFLLWGALYACPLVSYTARPARLSSALYTLPVSYTSL